MKKIIFIILLLSCLGTAWAQPFVVRNIEIEGLQRVAPATVESYLPVKRGQVLQANQTAEILRVLYQTGFFDHISLARKNSTLVIHVVERPTIGQLKIVGNSVIPTDKLTSVMGTVDVAEGRVYNPVILEKIKQSLLNQYYQLGRYNARVDITATPMPRNRVFVKIIISEGLVAKIKRISIVGNHAYDEKILLKQLDLTTTGLLTFFTQTDRYSEDKLDSSVTKLKNFYLDEGYLHFEVKSAQAQITPDRKAVYITIVVSEGQPYNIERFDVAGDLILPRESILKYITIKPGERFSRKKIIEIEKNINREYGDHSYLFATINIKPLINEQNHTVVIIFAIKPGKQTYVRYITFSDNIRTNDKALRREMLQMEAAPVSTTRLDDSKHRLSLLPYIQNVDMSIKPIPGIDDQVDVNYKVQEDTSAAQASFKVGYSQQYKLILGAGFNQKNVLGTGNTLGVNFTRSQYEQFYSIDYTNPYYTQEGISRSFNLSVAKVYPSALGINNGYTVSNVNLGVLYGIPIFQENDVMNRILVGVSYQNSKLDLSSNKALISNQVQSFVDRNGTNFNEVDFKLGITRDSRDRAIFPTKGVLQSLFFDAYAPLSNKSLSFYTINYHGRLFQPIYGPFIFTSRADLGYGNGFRGINDFPFFRNYYAGGIDSVRGFDDYSLGPLDSRGKPFGGNMLVDGSVGIIFPNYISDSLRTSVNFDAGNVYSSFDNTKFGGQSTNSGPIRYSVGVEADWVIPMLGPVQLSLARAFLRDHDSARAFQFALGMNF